MATRDSFGNRTYREISVRPEVRQPSQAGTISADILRHPITEKTRKQLRKAFETMQSGDHAAAIGQLLEILAKQPESAIYVHNLLGIEYMRTEQFRAAVSSFEQAVALLPHDSVTRYNWGLSLLCSGDSDRGQREIRKAVELDPKNIAVQEMYAILLKHIAPRAKEQAAAGE